ncbi:MAG: flagellar hook-associated protein FlgL, partial [Pisciglobus halotolerans]|nr:flagellar hook-associated protein FlgL [Pisciglobus halotolerans]
MRVTDSYMTSSFLNNLHKNMTNVQKYQDQLSSLKEVSRPSDDPMRVSQILDLNNSILQNSEYKTTIKDTIDFTNVQDSALSHASDSMSRIRTLIQQAANGTVNNEDRQIIKKEVEAEIRSLTDSLNTNFGGKYVFSGMNTTTKPFEVKTEDGKITGIQYSG